MQVSPINNTNFQGRFQKSPALEKILKYADRDSIGRFNDVVQRASKVNDGLLFSITEYPSTCERKTFCLHQTNTFKDITSIVTGVTQKINDAIGSGVKNSEILERFIPTLETIYPKKYITPKENLIAEITKNLV